jgi:transposase
MRRRGRPVIRIVLSPSERETLERYTRRATTAQALALRARIILRCATGETHTAIAAALQVSLPTVGKWRRRFVTARVPGLLDEPRPGAPRRLSDAAIEHVIVQTLESTPREATHWSTRSLAKQVGLTQTAVARIWKAFALQPHRTDTFKLSKDPLFIEKVRDIVGLDLHPPDRALVLCVDEKSQIQALDRTAPLLPMRPGHPERRTHDYVRHGTTSLFAALDVQAGTVIGTVMRGIAPASFAGSSTASTPRCRSISTCISFSTTTRRTRHQRSIAGLRGTRAITCTSRPRAPRG